MSTEAFASPLNCYCPSYFSAFSDVDTPFGSLGTFAVAQPQRGSFEVLVRVGIRVWGWG